MSQEWSHSWSHQWHSNIHLKDLWIFIPRTLPWIQFKSTWLNLRDDLINEIKENLHNNTSEVTDMYILAKPEQTQEQWVVTTLWVLLTKYQTHLHHAWQWLTSNPHQLHLLPTVGVDKCSGKQLSKNLHPGFLLHFWIDGKTQSWCWLALRRQS